MIILYNCFILIKYFLCEMCFNKKLTFIIVKNENEDELCYCGLCIIPFLFTNKLAIN